MDLLRIRLIFRLSFVSITSFALECTGTKVCIVSHDLSSPRENFLQNRPSYSNCIVHCALTKLSLTRDSLSCNLDMIEWMLLYDHCLTSDRFNFFLYFVREWAEVQNHEDVLEKVKICTKIYSYFRCTLPV